MDKNTLQTMETIANVCHLMGETNRLKILFLCLKAPQSVSMLVKELEISQPLVSHHLKLLKTAKLLFSERNGKQINYHIFDDHIRCILEDMYQHYSDKSHLTTKTQSNKKDASK
ncbi:ArsR/SmtB family transcription factor [Fangia hongkongensis]|uniref:ArsR/SmtB family transcription factor n=2 Tax=Fangia hongkongensis TaxID=270495 RepID=UPI00035F4AAF|nr:metalloregulator ArsR/SmtB family transcription factor [Fangia hongkongensis]